jgi:hypothetical protein
VTDAADPLEPLYGRSTQALFATYAVSVVHGPRERLPLWMRSGPLEHIAALSSAYKGPLEIAQGPTTPKVAGQEFMGQGGQARVQGVRADLLLRLGLTVFFADITKTVPESAAFLRSVEAALGVPSCSVAGVFANAPGSGLPWHHDSHDQLFIQLAGKKTFCHVAERSVDHPGIPFSPTSITHPDYAAVYAQGFVDSAEAIERKGVVTTTLQPGSCLFLPAGTFHRTADQPEAALSLIVAVRPPSRLDLLVAALRHGALASPRWRAPAYGLFSAAVDASRTPERAALPADLAHLAQQLAELTEPDLVRAWLAVSRAKIDSPSAPTGVRFSRYLRIPSTELDWEPPTGDVITCAVRPVDAALPSRLQLALLARPIVDRVLGSTRAFSAQEMSEEFPEFDEADLHDLLDQLLRVGLLCPLPFSGFPPA